MTYPVSFTEQREVSHTERAETAVVCGTHSRDAGFRTEHVPPQAERHPIGKLEHAFSLPEERFVIRLGIPLPRQHCIFPQNRECSRRNSGLRACSLDNVELGAELRVLTHIRGVIVQICPVVRDESPDFSGALRREGRSSRQKRRTPRRLLCSD